MCNIICLLSFLCYSKHSVGVQLSKQGLFSTSGEAVTPWKRTNGSI